MDSGFDSCLGIRGSPWFLRVIHGSGSAEVCDFWGWFTAREPGESGDSGHVPLHFVDVVSLPEWLRGQT